MCNGMYALVNSDMKKIYICKLLGRQIFPVQKCVMLAMTISLKFGFATKF